MSDEELGVILLQLNEKEVGQLYELDWDGTTMEHTSSKLGDLGLIKRYSWDLASLTDAGRELIKFRNKVEAVKQRLVES